MTSFGTKLVKSAIRLYTYPKRKKHLSLSRTVTFKNSAYRPPKGFTHRITELNGVKVENLTPQGCDQSAAIVQFHGCGATVSMNNFYRRISERYAKITHCAVYSIDYKTGAELRHPALLNDCYNAYIGIVGSKNFPKKVIAVGDSMGANLILTTCLKLRDEHRPLPSAIVSVCIGADLSASGDSYRKNCYSDPLYSLPKYQNFKENEAGIRRISPYTEGTDLKDPYLSPAFADLTGFPKLLIQCGDCETSESDNDMVFENACAANVDVTFTKYEGMFHCFQYLTPFLKESKTAWKEIASFLQEVIGNR